MARSLMIQGTMSGVGKSLIVAGLCRVLAQDGVQVAPFKSQNMALNSAVTADGLELGRAQAVQAEAAGIEPTTAMNPILLKPTTDVGSQVIIRGRAVANMSAREYFAHRAGLAGTILDAYRELERSYDVILIEGAGSPVELNLKRDDIVNMGLAALVDAPVALVGDIDRGGVFAQLIGTMMLLEDDERRLVKASVVNRFRGDATLFEDGRAMLAERMGVPVAGVVPYLDVDIDDEDSLSERLGRRRARGLVDIAVLRLPRIANFTDFVSLEATLGMSVRYVRRASELGDPDLVIIPGSKATMADLAWLREAGLAERLCELARGGTPTLGICGGYQMLGLSIEDPLGVEGGGTAEGLGLLPVRTRFGKEKRTVRSSGSFGEVEGALQALSGRAVTGYEMHMGTTWLEGGAPLLELEDATGERVADGCQLGSTYGCYLHGLFDEAAVAQALAEALLARRGVVGAEVRAVDMASYRERQYDLLAEALRAHLDMELIYRIIEEGA